MWSPNSFLKQDPIDHSNQQPECESEEEKYKHHIINTNTSYHSTCIKTLFMLCSVKQITT